MDNQLNNGKGIEQETDYFVQQNLYDNSSKTEIKKVKAKVSETKVNKVTDKQTNSAINVQPPRQRKDPVPKPNTSQEKNTEQKKSTSNITTKVSSVQDEDNEKQEYVNKLKKLLKEFDIACNNIADYENIDILLDDYIKDFDFEINWCKKYIKKVKNDETSFNKKEWDDFQTGKARIYKDKDDILGRFQAKNAFHKDDDFFNQSSLVFLDDKYYQIYKENNMGSQYLNVREKLNIKIKAKNSGELKYKTCLEKFNELDKLITELEKEHKKQKARIATK